VGYLYGDHRETQHWEYTTNQDAIDASSVVAKVVHLKAALPLSLHSMRAPLGKVLDQLSAMLCQILPKLIDNI
jgi:hypothetical protein